MKKRGTKKTGLAAASAAGITVCLLLSILLSWAAAMGIEKELVPEDRTSLCVLAATLISVQTGVFAGCTVAADRWIPAGGIIAGGYYLILVCMNAVFFDGQFAGAGVRALTVAAGTGIAMLLKRGGKRRVRHRRVRV